MNHELIFVYGTLRRACPTGAHEKYLAGAEYIAPAKIRGKLFKVSYYPGLVVDETSGWVVGEIYRLVSQAQLSSLDVYEECTYPPLPGQEYQRLLVTVLTDTGEPLSAWVYAYQHASEHLQYIASGDFLNP